MEKFQEIVAFCNLILLWNQSTNQNFFKRDFLFIASQKI